VGMEGRRAGEGREGGGQRGLEGYHTQYHALSLQESQLFPGLSDRTGLGV
jgi:hypothetical protein